MKEEILDNFEEKTTPKFANKSFKQLIYGLLFYGLIILFNLVFRPEFGSWKIPGLLSVVFGLIAFILMFIGLLNGIKSIRRKEDSFWKKYGATFGNFIFGLIMALILYANFIDLYLAFS